MTALVLVFKKIEERKHDNFYSSSKAETITNESDIDNVGNVWCTVHQNINVDCVY